MSFHSSPMDIMPWDFYYPVFWFFFIFPYTFKNRARNALFWYRYEIILPYTLNAFYGPFLCVIEQIRN